MKLLRGRIFTKKAFSFMEFFVRNIFFKNVWNLYVERIKERVGTLNENKLPLFDRSLTTLEFWHKIMLSFKEMRFCSIFGSNHKKVFRKLAGRWSSRRVHFEELKLYEKWYSSGTLQLIFPERLQKKLNCRIVKLNQS